MHCIQKRNGFLHFIKYSTQWDMFQIKLVDIEKTPIL
jgi:hypothetical protein